MPSALPCPEDAALWRALDDRPLRPATACHLAGCALCRERLQRLREERAALQRLRRREPPASSAQPESACAAGHDSRPPEETAAPPCPERIGRYPLLGRIGAGGQAEVYRALHPTLGCRVILKAARASLRPGDEARWSILREGRILAAIDEPVLARVLDLDFHDDRPFLVLEDVTGEALTEVVRRQSLTDEEIADLMHTLARAVQAAHEAGVLHLDLKPENVLLTPEGRPRLIDFGTALLHRAHGAAAVDGWVVGTPSYMAPEQHAGDPTLLTPQTDVYGLGGILHFLLYGVPPHGGSSGELPAAAGDGSNSSEPAPPGSGSLLGSVQAGSPLRRRLAAVAHRALAERPQARFTDAAEMAADLGRARRGNRQLHRVCGAALLLAAGAACAVWSWWTTPPGAESEEGLALSAAVEVNGRVLPLIQALPFTAGSAMQVGIATPNPEQTRLFLVRQDGRAIPCSPLAQTPLPEPELLFPADGRRWPVRGLPEFNLLLAGMNLAGPAPAPEEIERALHGVQLRLSPEDDWLVVSDARSDPRRVIRSSSPEQQSNGAPQDLARKEIRENDNAADETEQAARELRAALDQVCDRYQAVLFRCQVRTTRSKSAAGAFAGAARRPKRLPGEEGRFLPVRPAHAIAARLLGDVELLVGVGQELLGAAEDRPVGMGHADADGERNLQTTVPTEGSLFHPPPDALGHHAGVVGLRLAEDDGELLAADARKQIVHSNGRLHPPAEFLQAFVPDQMAVQVVDALEMIHVQQQHGDRPRVPDAPAQLAAKAVVEVPAVGDIGETVAGHHLVHRLVVLRLRMVGGEVLEDLVANAEIVPRLELLPDDPLIVDERSVAAVVVQHPAPLLRQFDGGVMAGDEIVHHLDVAQHIAPDGGQPGSERDEVFAQPGGIDADEITGAGAGGGRQFGDGTGVRQRTGGIGRHEWTLPEERGRWASDGPPTRPKVRLPLRTHRRPSPPPCRELLLPTATTGQSPLLPVQSYRF